MKAIFSSLAGQGKGIFSNSSGFVINGGVFTVSESSSKAASAGNGEATPRDAESEVYARFLLPKKKGYPLWNPGVSDNLPPEYRERGVSIGDVGTIDEEGGFQYLFNVLLPSDHPMNGAERVPAGFTPLSVPLYTEKRANQYAPGTHIANPESDICKTPLGYREVEMTRELDAALRAGKVPPEVGYGFRFDVNGPEGAILILPEGGIREDHPNEDIFDNYAAKNAISWYAHVNGVLGRRLGGNSLMLVTGVDKTTAWGAASFCNAEKGTVHMTMVPNTRTQSKYWFRSVSYATAHSGPPQNSLKEELPGSEVPNQCVFVRGIRVSVKPAALPKTSRLTVQTRSLRKLSLDDILSPSRFIPYRGNGTKNIEPPKDKAKLNPRPSEPSETEPETETTVVTTSRIPSKRLPYHPLAVINEYLLGEHPDADVVLSNDSCWFSLIEDGENDLPSDTELLRRVKDKYDAVLSNGIIRLVPTERKNNQPPQPMPQLPNTPTHPKELPASGGDLSDKNNDSFMAANSQALSSFAQKADIPSASDDLLSNSGSNSPVLRNTDPTVHEADSEEQQDDVSHGETSLDPDSGELTHDPDETSVLPELVSADTTHDDGGDTDRRELNSKSPAEHIKDRVYEGTIPEKHKSTALRKHVQFSKDIKEYPPRVTDNSPSSTSSRGPITPPSNLNPLPTYARQMKQPQQSHIHRLLLYSSRPSLNYDVSLPVSTMTTCHRSLPATILNESALNPPVASSLKLTTSLIPWSIHVNPSNGYLVTVADVLNAIYHSLRTNITQAEYSMLPSRSDVKQVNDAYEYRYRRVHDYRASIEEKRRGIKRVDFLRRRTRFMGLTPSDNPGSLILNLE